MPVELLASDLPWLDTILEACRQAGVRRLTVDPVTWFLTFTISLVQEFQQTDRAWAV
jgi:hypothetical protein